LIVPIHARIRTIAGIVYVPRPMRTDGPAFLCSMRLSSYLDGGSGDLPRGAGIAYGASISLHYT